MNDREPSAGLIVIDKPAGWTSHQVVGRVRRILGVRKVGHAGTLDPMATGLLLVAFGRATRLLGHLAGKDKTYLATIRLGVSTSTDDADGEIITKLGVNGLQVADVATALATLRGDIAQVPSAVSAIKVAGRRAYQRVRDGETVELAPRMVTVSRLDILSSRTICPTDQAMAMLDLDVVVDCSTGTYIRALARDLGAALGVGGHLTRLRRTRIGDWQLGEASPIDAETTDLTVLSIHETARRAFPAAVVTDQEAQSIRHGRRLVGHRLANGLTAMINSEGEFLALYRPDGGDAIAHAVYVTG